ncbi:MAG: phospholipid carrier-dependent glycosyltransferase [Agarilytica sp.]
MLAQLSQFNGFVRHHVIEHPFVVKHPNRSIAIAIALLALFSRFFLIGHPGSAVFDEVHFNYFAGFYYTGQYYYDIHPPLAKLLIALSALPFGGIAPDEVIRTISTAYPTDIYMAERSLPAIFGSILPVILFLLAKEFNFSTKAAVLASLLVIFDNAFLIQSRLILLDSMLWTFGFIALYFFVIARRSNNWLLFCLAAVFAGCSLSVKWIGVSFLGLIGLIIIFDWLRSLWWKGWQFEHFGKGCAFLAISICTYMTVFYIHFALLPISHQQGDQFMTPSFRSTLTGSEYHDAEGTVESFKCPTVYRNNLHKGMQSFHVKAQDKKLCQIEYKPYERPGFIAKFLELNKVMYATNQGLSASHPDGSSWHEWPFMHKPLYYWFQDGARIYLIGNPLVWWLSALAVAVLLLGHFKMPHWRDNQAFWILGIGFISNVLPFVIVTRVMFMYHYLTALCFGVLLCAYLIDRLNILEKKYAFPAFIGLIILGFLMISPLTYGVNWYGSDMLWFLRAFGWHP